MFNKILIKAVLTLSLALSATGFANAALITQDVLVGGVVQGSVTVNTVPSTDVGSGYYSVESFESFDLFGINLILDTDLGHFFVADFLGDDLSAGIQYMAFDIDDDFAPDPWAFQGEIEAGFDGILDVFSVNNPNLIAFFDNVSFGEASVVPEPAAVLLFLAGIAGIATRRRTFK